MPLEAHSTPGRIVLLGSGELADAMAEVHRTVMGHLAEPVRPVFVDALAGFELNVDQIDQKAVDYFARNFGLTLAVARYRTAQERPESVAAALTAIQNANYIFAGPGSPSYGVRILRESSIWRAILERWRAGATIVCASAAAITLGAVALPVYEIYKAGQDVGWMAGLDLLGEIGLRAAVVPHWNNQSGSQHDTRFCYMGAPRLAILEQQLPPDSLVIGIDEYTGLSIDSRSREATVLGVGQVTLRRQGRQAAYSKGQCAALGAPTLGQAALVPLAPVTAPDAPDDAAEAGIEDISALRAAIQAACARGDAPAALDGLVTLSVIAGQGLEQGIGNRVELAVQVLQATLPALAALVAAPREQMTAPPEPEALLAIVIAARAALREAGQWTAADAVRDQLAAQGYVLSDTPDGTTWQRVTKG